MELLIIAAVVWFACGIASSFIAERKGNSEMLGCLTGVILGPLGVIMVSVAPSNTGALEQGQLRRGSLKRCPFCAEAIKAEATVCRYCGRDLPTAP